ncbi:MAG: PKD domain-containing protein [Thermoplasmata archaeon]
MVPCRPRRAGASGRLGLTVLIALVALTSVFALPTTATPGTVHTAAPPAPLRSFLRAEALGAAPDTNAPRTGASPADTPLSSASAGSVVRTVFPGFNTSLPGSFTSSVYAWQVGSPTYVPSTDTLWFPQRSVSLPGYPIPTIAPAAVYNLSTGGFSELVTNLSNASALVYDPVSGNVYAALPASNSVAVVNPRTGAIVDPAILVGTAPDALAVDPNANELFVANSGSSNVTVIDITDNTVSFPNIPVGSDPVSLAVDPKDDIVFVANAESMFVSMINISKLPTTLTHIPLIYGPASALAYSAGSDTVIASIPSSRFATIIGGEKQVPVTQVVPVGTGIVASAPSANGTEFLVGNSTGGNVVALNSTIGTFLSTIPVFRNASQLVLDPQSGLVYCWTSGSRDLESVNLSSDTAKTVAPTTSPELLSISALPTQSETYVSSVNDSLVYGLNSTRLNQASPVIAASAVPLSVVSDPANGKLYVGMSNGLEAYNASSDRLNATFTALSGSCSQLVLDQPDNLLWLSNSVLGVVAMNLTTHVIAFETGLVVPPGSTQGIAIDSSNAEAFVLVPPNTVKVRSTTTDQPLSSGINVGANVTSLAYDAADNQVYAAGDEVTLVNGATLAVDGGPVLIGGPHKVLGEVYEPSRKDIYFASVGLLPGKQGTVTVLDGSSISASESSAVEIPVGEVPDAFGVVTSGNYDGLGSGMVWVANELSGTVSVISSPPEITSFTASPSAIDLGYPVSIDLQYLGGAGPSMVTYYGLPPGCSSADKTELNCTPSSVGVFALAANVTDSFGNSANLTATLTVAESLSILPEFSVPTFPDLDVGVPLSAVSTTVLGGVPPYTYQWSWGDGTTSSGSNPSHTYAQPGVFLLTTTVRDATGATNVSSAVVMVSPDPSVRVLLSPGNMTDVAIPLSLNATVTGGTGSSQEKWTFGDGTESVGLNNTSHAWDRPGTYTVTFAYIDALGVAANRSVNVTVHSSLTATFTAGSASSSNAASTGSPVNFTSNISGGTPPYRESWSFGDGSFASGLLVNHSYASAGTYRVTVILDDAVGGGVESNLSVTVAASPSSGGSVTGLNGGFGSGLFLGLVLGGVAAAVVLFLAAPRRGARPPPPGPVSPYVPP